MPPKAKGGRGILVNALDTMLGELRRKRELLDNAIAGLEALA